MPKVKPSERCILASEQGEKTWLVSLRDSERMEMMYIKMIVAICLVAIVKDRLEESVKWRMIMIMSLFEHGGVSAGCLSFHAVLCDLSFPFLCANSNFDIYLISLTKTKKIWC